MAKKNYQLTRYPIGSLREIWGVAWPLMLGLLSGGLMLFSDRLLLARYSLDALTASANSSMAVFAFLIGPFAIAGISEVFVGQYHGNEDFKNVGPAAWQMLWFALFTTPFYVLIAYIGPFFLFRGTGNEVLEAQYFTPLTAFGAFFCMIPALIGFFSGLGKVYIIFIANFTANILNIILDYLLIFGYGPIPSFGILGAAIGTIVAQLFQLAFLFLFFLSEENRTQYATTHYRFRRPLFIRSIQIGIPAGLSLMSEMLAHLAFFRVMIGAGKNYITIISIVQSLYFLIDFIKEGLSKAVTAIVSNLIGAFHFEKIGKVLTSSFILQAIFSAFLMLGLYLFGDSAISLFLHGDQSDLLQDSDFISSLKMCLFWLGVFFWLDGWVWVLIGGLTAAGDTKFIMIIGFIGQWLFYFTPTYIGVRVFSATVDQAWMLICLNSLLLLLIYIYRYNSEKWQAITIRGQEP